MSFPVYFALNWKESVNDPRIFPAQYGFGFTEGGVLRLPNKIIPDALRIIDDAVLPKDAPNTMTIGQLADLCEKGCLLDFERAPSRMHAAILLGLSQHCRGFPLFAAPERYLRLLPSLLPLVSPPTRCANWKEFVIQAEQRHPNGWMLELIPCKYSVQMPFSAQNSGELTDALCCYRQAGRTIRYFDTPKTLEKKLTAAMLHSCRAAIGIYQELSTVIK